MTEQQPQQSAEERKQPLRMQKGKQYQYISLFEETNKRGFAKKKKKETAAFDRGGTFLT